MNQPNILIFMTDQQRAKSIYPFSEAITPNIDRFCHEGITFTNAHTVSPHCCPSRASFFSGLYPSGHGVWNNIGVANTLSKGLYDGVRLFSEDLTTLVIRCCLTANGMCLIMIDLTTEVSRK